MLVGALLQAEFPDLDVSGAVDMGDVGPFVDILLGQAAPPDARNGGLLFPQTPCLSPAADLRPTTLFSAPARGLDR